MLDASVDSKQLLKFLKRPLVYLILRRGRLEQLPPEVRGYSHHANEELMKSVPLELDASTPEIIVFSEENDTVRYISSLAADVNRPVFGFIATPPQLLADRLTDSKAEWLIIDRGSVNEQRYARHRFDQLKRLAQVVSLSLKEKLFIAENGKGVALLAEYRGAKYAIGYQRSDITADQERKLNDLSPRHILAENKIPKVVGGILRSDLAGLLLDYGHRQNVLGREELQLLRKVYPRVKGGFLAKLKKLSGA